MRKTILSTPVVILLIVVGIILVSPLIPYITARPQSISAYVSDQTGRPLSDVIVQGFMPKQGSQGGFAEVFRSRTQSDGRLTLTNLTEAHKISRQWVDYQGEYRARISSPTILLFLTYVASNGNLYFEQSSINMNTLDLLNEVSYSVSKSLDLTRPIPNVTIPRSTASNTLLSSPAPQDVPFPSIPSGCFLCYWVWIGRDGPVGYPTEITWMTLQGNAYGSISTSLAASSTTYFSLGYAIGANINSAGTSAVYGIGGQTWTYSSSFVGFLKSSGLTSPGSSTIYLNGWVEGDLFQLYSSILGPTTTYQYSVGIVNVQVDANKAIQGGSRLGLPVYAPDLPSYYYLSLNTLVAGQGSGPGVCCLPPNSETYSFQLANTFMASDTQYVNIAIDVGAILGRFTVLKVPLSIALQISATIGSLDVSATQTAVQYDAPSGSTVYVYNYVGTAAYTLPSGGTGHIPLMGVVINGVVTSGGGGGGSIAYGSLINMADGSMLPVQNLQVGDKMLGYVTSLGQFVDSTVLSIIRVGTPNMLIIHTATGIPFRVDANPHQTLWTMTSDGTVGWLPVTQIQPGDYLFTPNGWTPVTRINFAPRGLHVMFDVIASVPYFADGYLDPVLK